MAAIESYGTRLPGLDLSELTGKLIVVEGPDGVGRSTQISLLKIWLQMNGRAVMDTESGQASLTGDGLKTAKQGHTLGPIAFTLFYATDLTDNLEHIVIPALRAGFVVVIDRYIYTSLARAMVRGMDRDWLKRVYSFALVPHAIIYLRLDLKDLIHRVLHSSGFNYWESGMDLRLGETYYESFCEYQKRLIESLDSLTKEYDAITIDASKNIEEVEEEIKRKLAPTLGFKHKGLPAESIPESPKEPARSTSKS